MAVDKPNGDGFAGEGASKAAEASLAKLWRAVEAGQAAAQPAPPISRAAAGGQADKSALLHEAIIENSFALAERRIDSGAAPQPEHLEATAAVGRAAMASLLIAHGGDALSWRQSGRNALRAAARRTGFSSQGDDAEFEGHLAGIGLRPDDIGRDTLIHVAASSGDAETVRVFLAAGLDANEPGLLGDGPLHRAASPSAAAALIEAGAAVGAVNMLGEAPLHRVAGAATAKLLLAQGADRSAMDWQGKTAADRNREIDQPDAELTALLAEPEADGLLDAAKLLATSPMRALDAAKKRADEAGESGAALVISAARLLSRAAALAKSKG